MEVRLQPPRSPIPRRAAAATGTPRTGSIYRNDCKVRRSRWATRGSRLRLRQMFKNRVHDPVVAAERDDRHLAATARTGRRVDRLSELEERQ